MFVSGGVRLIAIRLSINCENESLESWKLDRYVIDGLSMGEVGNTFFEGYLLILFEPSNKKYQGLWVSRA